MSAAPVHAENVAQAEYWSGAGGQRWIDHQEHQDQVLRPVLNLLIKTPSSSRRCAKP
jgi:hypothetical protein